MKQSIFFLLLFISSLGYGQVFKNLEPALDAQHLMGYSTATTTGTVTASSTSEEIHSTDTVKITMLVCDTLPYWGATTAMAYIDPIARAEQVRHTINWINGYAVRDVVLHTAGWYWFGNRDFYNQKEYTTYDVKYYIDDLYKPLPKTYIVWQTKTL